MATTDRDETLRGVLATVAPGTALRDGLERILRGNTGALIVLGWDRVVEQPVHRRLPARRRVLGHPAARAVQDGRRGRAVHRRRCGSLRAATHLMPDPAIPTEESGHPAPHRPAGRAADRLSRSSRCRSRCGSSACTSATAATCWRAAPSCCRAPTRPSPPSSGTRRASTRCRTRCPRSRSRTSSPSATPRWWRSGSRWCAGSPTRSPARSSSSAPTAGCSRCSSTS